MNGKKRVSGVELADRMKKGLTKKFLKDNREIEQAGKISHKKKITKKEAVLIADAVKKGMSLKVLRDLEEIKKTRVPLAKQS